MQSYGALLRLPSVGRVLLSMALGRIAATMLTVAVVLLAFTHYRSPELAGIVAFALAAPALLVGPIAGALLDRRGRTRLVVLDNVASAIALALIGVLVLVDALPAWLFVGIVAISSLTTPLSLNGLRSLLPILVPERLWGRVNALDSNAFVVAQLAGPAAAGVLFQLVGGPAAVLIIGLLLLLTALATIGIREPPLPRSGPDSLLREAWLGLQYTLRNATLRALGVAMTAFYFGYGVLTILVPAIVLNRFGEGPATVGIAWAAMAVAGGVAAIAFGRFDMRGREPAVLAGSILLTALGLAIVPAADGIGLVLAGLLVVGLAQGPLDIAMFTLRQRRTDPAWLGRAFAVSVALNGAGSPVGAVLAGSLVGISIAATGALAVAATVVSAALAWLLLPRAEPTTADR